jgi:integrase
MARRVLDRYLDSKDARRRLAPRAKPYFRTVERGLHLGYRRLNNGAAGPWIARHYRGDRRYEEEAIGHADDLSDADGVAILTYWQAVEVARERMKLRVQSAAGIVGPYTVADAVTAYLEFLYHKRNTAYDVRKRMEAHVLPQLGKIEVASVTADKLRKWHADLACKPPRLRSKSGKEQKYRPLADDEDSLRRRRASANRCLAQLKAALNLAWRENKAPSDKEWRKVKPFEGADAARVRYLTVAECRRLLKACDPVFRNLARAALETGARYGELVRLTVDDFNQDNGTIAIRISKTGKPRHVVLTNDGAAFFEQVCLHRAGSEPMLLKEDGSMWRKSHQLRPMNEACRRGKIDPPINFHALRHTWASLAAMNGVPLLIVAKNLGHSDTRMVEKHYGHLAPSYIADAIRAGAPRFGKVKPRATSQTMIATRTSKSRGQA